MKLTQLNEATFPKELKNAQEIADYIESISMNYVDHEYMYEYFRGAKAFLQKVNIADLVEGPSEAHQRNTSKEKKYMKNPENMPPIVIENNKIIDGHHRFRAAKKAGLKKLTHTLFLEFK